MVGWDMKSVDWGTDNNLTMSTLLLPIYWHKCRAIKNKIIHVVRGA